MHDRQAGWFARGIQRSAPGHPNAPRSTPNTLQRLNIGYLFILGILAAHPAHSFGSQTVACSSSALHTVNPTRIAVSPSFLAVCAQPQRCTVCRRASPRSSLPGTITLIAIFPVPGPGGCPTLKPLRRFTCKSPVFPNSVHPLQERAGRAGRAGQSDVCTDTGFRWLVLNPACRLHATSPSSGCSSTIRCFCSPLTTSPTFACLHVPDCLTARARRSAPVGRAWTAKVP
jgi:hypothetical protein